MRTRAVSALPICALSPDQWPFLLTVRETADLLRTTPHAVYLMISAAKLPGVTRVGRRVLVRREALLELLGQKSAPSVRSAER